MLEGKGAKVGLLTTDGFRDALEIRRGLREDQWNYRKPYAPVLVPRHLRKGVWTHRQGWQRACTDSTR
jgi:N-methylhydantoinase A